MAELPTWNGQPMDRANIVAVSREAFDIALEVMTGTGVLEYSKDELLHLLEAGTLLDHMSSFANELALQLARERGASWGQLGAAMGVSRSSAQYRYERQVREYEEREGLPEHRRMAKLIESAGSLASIVDVRPVIYRAAEAEGWRPTETPGDEEDCASTTFERDGQWISVSWNDYGEIAGSSGNG